MFQFEHSHPTAEDSVINFSSLHTYQTINKTHAITKVLNKLCLILKQINARTRQTNNFIKNIITGQRGLS